MKYLASAMTLYLALTTTAFACDLSVTDPWIRAAPPNAKALAGYMVLKNAGSEDCVLTGARAEGFKMAMLHRTMEKDGMAQMVHQEKVTVPAGEELIFKPKDYHIMLMRPQKPLQKGDTVLVTLVLEDGNEQRVEFPVR